MVVQGRKRKRVHRERLHGGWSLKIWWGLDGMAVKVGIPNEKTAQANVEKCVAVIYQFSSTALFTFLCY